MDAFVKKTSLYSIPKCERKPRAGGKKAKADGGQANS